MLVSILRLGLFCKQEKKVIKIHDKTFQKTVAKEFYLIVFVKISFKKAFYLFAMIELHAKLTKTFYFNTNITCCTFIKIKLLIHT